MQTTIRGQHPAKAAVNMPMRRVCRLGIADKVVAHAVANVVAGERIVIRKSCVGVDFRGRLLTYADACGVRIGWNGHEPMIVK